MAQFRIAVLSGGAGTRLWPLSRESFPKQFYDLAGTGYPLLIDALKRLENLGSLSVITTEPLKPSTIGLLNRFGIKADIIGEPQARNTAPAVLLAALTAYREEPTSVVGIFPADHTIKNVARFREILARGFEAASKGAVVTLGIPPAYPSTGYGYLDLENAVTESQTGSVRVMRFIEKPSFEKAEVLMATGKVMWNAGMFLFRADVMKSLFEKHLPQMAAEFAKLKPDLSNLADVYAAVKPESVDFGVMEKLDSLVCFGADIGWSDIGSWEEIAKHGKCLGHPVEIGSKNNFYTGIIPEGKRVAFVSVSDLVAVDTPDALLITRKGEGQGVRAIVEELKRQKSSSIKTHSFEERPWGRFEVLMDTDHFKSKRIIVQPGQELSYQSHAKRAEHWVIVKGSAEVTLNDVQHPLKAGDHIFIPQGAKHRVANPGGIPMEFIEVQTGTYFGEDDIVRYSDAYGRAP